MCWQKLLGCVCKYEKRRCLRWNFLCTWDLIRYRKQFSQWSSWEVSDFQNNENVSISWQPHVCWHNFFDERKLLWDTWWFCTQKRIKNTAKRVLAKRELSLKATMWKDSETQGAKAPSGAENLGENPEGVRQRARRDTEVQKRRLTKRKQYISDNKVSNAMFCAVWAMNLDLFCCLCLILCVCSSAKMTITVEGRRIPVDISNGYDPRLASHNHVKKATDVIAQGSSQTSAKSTIARKFRHKTTVFPTDINIRHKKLRQKQHETESLIRFLSNKPSFSALMQYPASYKRLGKDRAEIKRLHSKRSTEDLNAAVSAAPAPEPPVAEVNTTAPRLSALPASTSAPRTLPFKRNPPLSKVNSDCLLPEHLCSGHKEYFGHLLKVSFEWIGFMLWGSDDQKRTPTASMEPCYLNNRHRNQFVQKGKFCSCSSCLNVRISGKMDQTSRHGSSNTWRTTTKNQSDHCAPRGSTHLHLCVLLQDVSLDRGRLEGTRCQGGEGENANILSRMVDWTTSIEIASSFSPMDARMTLWQVPLPIHSHQEWFLWEVALSTDSPHQTLRVLSRLLFFQVFCMIRKFRFQLSHSASLLLQRSRKIHPRKQSLLITRQISRSLSSGMFEADHRKLHLHKLQLTPSERESLISKKRHPSRDDFGGTSPITSASIAAALSANIPMAVAVTTKNISMERRNYSRSTSSHTTSPNNESRTDSTPASPVSSHQGRHRSLESDLLEYSLPIPAWPVTKVTENSLNKDNPEPSTQISAYVANAASFHEPTAARDDTSHLSNSCPSFPVITKAASTLTLSLDLYSGRVTTNSSSADDSRSQTPLTLLHISSPDLFTEDEPLHSVGAYNMECEHINLHYTPTTSTSTTQIETRAEVHHVPVSNTEQSTPVVIKCDPATSTNGHDNVPQTRGPSRRAFNDHWFGAPYLNGHLNSRSSSPSHEFLERETVV